MEKVSMKEIVEKYNDCDMFSLTCDAREYNVSKEDFLKALENIETKDIQELKEIYDKYQLNDKGYSSFEELYSNIKDECIKYNSEENKEKYIKNRFTKEVIDDYKRLGFSDTQIKDIMDNFFCCGFIESEVGKTTKYGDEVSVFYRRISYNIDRLKEENMYLNNKNNDYIKILPQELKNNLLRYEISFYNEVTTSNRLMINYYFSLNDETKKYLLKYESDYDLEELQDLTIYKNNQVKFYSCTHELFNSLE